MVGPCSLDGMNLSLGQKLGSYDMEVLAQVTYP